MLTFAQPSPNTSSVRERRWMPMHSRCRATYPIVSVAASDVWHEEDHVAVTAGCARVVPTARAGARGAGGSACRRRRPLARAAHRGLPRRYFSVVFTRATGALVVAGSARGALP